MNYLQHFSLSEPVGSSIVGRDKKHAEVCFSCPTNLFSMHHTSSCSSFCFINPVEFEANIGFLCLLGRFAEPGVKYSHGEASEQMCSEDVLLAVDDSWWKLCRAADWIVNKYMLGCFC